MLNFNKNIFGKVDWMLFFSILIIPCLGLIVLYSAGYNHDVDSQPLTLYAKLMNSKAFIKQVVFLSIAIVILFITSLIPAHFLQSLSYLLYGAFVSLLLAVSLFGVVSKGSRRWLDFGPIHLQPSEMMKIGIILAMARYLSSKPPPKGGYNLLQIITPLAIFIIPMAFIIKQPDLGTALAVGGVGFMMLFFMGIRWKTLLFMIVMFACAVPIGWKSLHTYQQNRIINLFNPDFDPKGSGYHVAQSKIAVGSGQLFGKGFLKGTQTQLEFLPEHTTDFIFSVLGEEWGFFGCFVVILAYVFLLWQILRIASKSKDLYQSLLAVGVACLILFHATVNMGMVVGLLPVVGIPLPLFSYGGSSILTMFIGLGLVMGVSIRRGGY